MKKLIFTLLFMMICTVSCVNYDPDVFGNEQVQNNTEQVFGVKFPSTQNWCTTINSTIKVNVNSDKNINKVQILLSNVNDSVSYLNLLNQATVKDGDVISLSFDTPNQYSNLFVAFINDKGQYFYKKFNVTDKEIYFEEPAKTRSTRALTQDYDIPTNTPIIGGTIESYSNVYNWLPGEMLYTFDYQAIDAEDYDTDFKAIFRGVIFNYFPNGRAYNNLPKIKKSGYYNESAYPITTGDEPIVVSPIYKNDGGYYEVCYGDLYYYYYKGENLTTEQIEALPKFKAIQLDDVFSNDVNDKIAKTKSYVLVYWGDGEPTTGSYQFPKGYKIGFMYRSNTHIDKKNNQPVEIGNKKQGELYCDGRLNYNVNKHGNFKTSGLGETEPRMAWMSVNDHMFLCVESGTDKDFNDLIIEVEGGIEPIIIIPDEPDKQFYTFCYEDQRLGDYDMNDVVLKGTRIDETHVEWTLMATGAMDRLYIKNIEGAHIKQTVEVHKILLGTDEIKFVNVGRDITVPYVTDVVTVAKDFSFLDVTKQPVVYDQTKNWEVAIARQGEDPHAIMIPYDFKWPIEQVCIKNAYLQFNNWGMGLIEDTDWYKYPEENKVVNP